LNPAATNRELVALSKIAFFRKSWVADYPDAENYLALFYSGNFSPNGPNYTHFKNKTYDELYLKAKTELDKEVRYELYRQMEEIILDEAVIVPLYYDQVVSYLQPYVEKMESNPLNLYDLKRVRISKTD
jgi:peptide/nickel transport system substrate-binding protein